MAKKQKNARKTVYLLDAVVTYGKGIYEPFEGMNGSEKLLTGLAFKKGSKEAAKFKKTITDAEKAILKEQFPDGYAAIKDEIKSPLKCGDKMAALDPDKHGKFKGYDTINITTTPEYPPNIVDSKNKPMTDSKIDSGDIVHAQITLAFYKAGGNIGISAYMQGFMLRETDQDNPFVFKSSNTADFSGFADAEDNDEKEFLNGK